MAKKKALLARPALSEAEAKALLTRKPPREELVAAIQFVVEARKGLGNYSEEWQEIETSRRLLEIVDGNLAKLQEFLESDFHNRRNWLLQIIQMAHTAGMCEGGMRDANHWKTLDHGSSAQRGRQLAGLNRACLKTTEDIEDFKRVFLRQIKFNNKGNPHKGDTSNAVAFEWNNVHPAAPMKASTAKTIANDLRLWELAKQTSQPAKQTAEISSN